jgi:YbbR domain-containing protein
MTDFLRRHVLHNLGLRLISVGLATGLWLALSREPIAEVAVDVPIEFRNIPANLEINSEHIPTAQIRLRGPERIVHRVRSSDVYVVINISDLKPGDRTFDLTAQQVRQPTGLEVVQVVPSEVHVGFDLRLTRQVPIHPRVMGAFADGYQIGQITVEPSTIAISGPKKRVENVEAAITDPVDVSGAIQQTTFVRHAYVSDPLVQVMRPDPVRITVHMSRDTVPEKP